MWDEVATVGLQKRERTWPRNTATNDTGSRWLFNRRCPMVVVDYRNHRGYSLIPGWRWNHQSASIGRMHPTIRPGSSGVSYTFRWMYTYGGVVCTIPDEPVYVYMPGYNSSVCAFFPKRRCVDYTGVTIWIYQARMLCCVCHVPFLICFDFDLPTACCIVYKYVIIICCCCCCYTWHIVWCTTGMYFQMQTSFRYCSTCHLTINVQRLF